MTGAPSRDLNDTAPPAVEGEERPPPLRSNTRLRRRGLRSYQARFIRRRPPLSRSVRASPPPGNDPCKSGSLLPVHSRCITLLHLNLRGFVSHRGELEARLEQLHYPDFVAITKSLLDASVVSPNLHKYRLISRRDRSDGRKGGGIILFARDDVSNQIVHSSTSPSSERTWHTLHTDAGPVRFGVWYRPPSYGEIDSIDSLADELQENVDNSIGTILVGDLNVHHKGWLRLSSGTPPEGKRLFQVCSERGLVECVGCPTRGNHLLDLVLTDFPKQVSTEILPCISDHKVVLCNLQLSIPFAGPAPRRVFLFHRAKCDVRHVNGP